MDVSEPEQRELLYLSRRDLESLAIGMGDVVEAVDAALRAKGSGEAVAPPKASLHGPGEEFSQVMAASLPTLGGLGVKWVSIFPQNRELGLPTVTGLVVLSDPADGLPVAVMDAGLITSWRTGASAGLAARYLARPGARRLGVLGCGVQARAGVEALAVVLPELDIVRCHDIDEAAARLFATSVAAAREGLECEVVASAAGVAEADVVLSAITMSDAPPPLRAGLLEEGALAVALDYDAAWSPQAMAECDAFYCDDTAQVLATKAAGARLAGIPGEIAGDLGQLAAGSIPGRTDERQRLFCMNLGLAVEDVVTARLAFDRALERGVGRKLPL